MLSWLNHSKIIYILSNLLVLPAAIVPYFDFLSNLSFIVLFLLLLRGNVFLLLLSLLVFIVKNNANYRFILLLKHKGSELSKSDYECVYLYAWCTFLRYLIIGIAFSQIILLFK